MSLNGGIRQPLEEVSKILEWIQTINIDVFTKVARESWMPVSFHSCSCR